MKLELKTENENYFKSFGYVISSIISFVLIIIFCDVALKIGVISRHYQFVYHCQVLSIDKSSLNFKKLSKLSKLKSKQKIWEFCREVVK